MSTDAFEATNLGLISGDGATRRAAVGRIVDRAKAIGAKTVLVPESGHAYQSLRWEAANDLGEALPFEVLAISEYVARAVDAGTISLKKAGDVSSVTYHDPCRLARQGGVFDEPRAVLKSMGLDPTIASSGDAELIMQEVRTRCRHCAAEDKCERWLQGREEGDSAFCPNHRVFERLGKYSGA